MKKEEGGGNFTVGFLGKRPASYHIVTVMNNSGFDALCNTLFLHVKRELGLHDEAGATGSKERKI